MSYIVTEGNATADAEIRFLNDGKPVASVTIMVNDRQRNNEGEWVDAGEAAYRVTVWGKPAETFAESAGKGTGVVVAGTLSIREWTDREGQTRISREINADHVGISTRFHSATSHRAARNSGS